MVKVVVDGADRDVQAGRDGAVAEAGGREPGDLALTIGEYRRRAQLGQGGRDHIVARARAGAGSLGGGGAAASLAGPLEQMGRGRRGLGGGQVPAQLLEGVRAAK